MATLFCKLEIWALAARIRRKHIKFSYHEGQRLSRVMFAPMVIKQFSLIKFYLVMSLMLIGHMLFSVTSMQQMKVILP